jgi:hypothetical protein
MLNILNEKLNQKKDKGRYPKWYMKLLLHVDCDLGELGAGIQEGNNKHLREQVQQFLNNTTEDNVRSSFYYAFS